MAKPPKKIPGSSPEDSTSTTTRPHSENTQLPGHQASIDHPDFHWPGRDTTPGTRPADASPDTHPSAESAIVITDLPTAGRSTPEKTDGNEPVRAFRKTVSLDELIIANKFARSLDAPDKDGIRKHSSGRLFVDLLDNTTVMVVLLEGGKCQAKDSKKGDVYGPVLERLEGTSRWQPEESGSGPGKRPPSAEPGEPTPGPSKRPRLDEESSDSPDTDIIADNLLSNESIALDLSYGLWRNWGRNTQPQSGQSIEIDGLHYPIVPQDMQSTTRLVYLQHPGFSPGRYDAFEQMLLDNPSLQPKWAIKKDNQWKVVERRLPFVMSLSQYVASSFKYLSNHSASTIARAVFNQISHFADINAHGLALMSRAFHHWADRISNEAPRRELADPLMMLPRLPTTLSGSETIISLPTPSAEALQRLDFDPERIPQEWNEYVTNVPGASLRSLFSTVLEHNGYVVNRTTRILSEDALLFHREGLDAVFVLRFPATSLLGSMKRPAVPGSELSDPAYRSRIGEEQWQELSKHLDLNKAIYLLGSTQPIGADQTTLVIVREG